MKLQRTTQVERGQLRAWSISATWYGQRRGTSPRPSPHFAPPTPQNAERGPDRAPSRWKLSKTGGRKSVAAAEDGRAPKRARGFTLIEIMVAMAVFTMVIASIYATWALVMRATQVGQDSAAQAQRQRVVLRAIGDALMGVQSFQASQQYYWFKLGNGSDPFLSFVSRLPDTYARHNKFVGGPDGPDSNSRRVTFSLATGQDGERDLILRQSPILKEMDDDEKQVPLVLAKNVKTFTIEWWGTNDMRADWQTEWDDKMTNTIPQMMRVHLVLGANTAKGREAPDFAATRIYTVPSQMMPMQIQRGIVSPAQQQQQQQQQQLLQNLQQHQQQQHQHQVRPQ